MAKTNESYGAPSGGHATTTDGLWPLVIAEIQRLGLPNGVKSLSFSVSGSGAGSTLTVTCN